MKCNTAKCVWILVVFLSLLAVRPAWAQLSFTEYAGPTTPTFESGDVLIDIAAGPDGNLWFTEGYALFGVQTQIGRITTAGVTTYFGVPSGSSEGAITAGPDGNLWFPEYRTSKIGRITTAGVITEFLLPTGGSFPQGITAGPDGNLWFTEFGANQIGRITPAGVITEFPVPTAGSYPQSITAGPDGNLWFTEQWGNQIGRITPDGVITEFSLPTAGSDPQRIHTGPDGNLWFTEDVGNNIGRITTAGVITEFPAPTPSRLTGITVGADGNLWFLEMTADKIVKATMTAPIVLSGLSLYPSTVCGCLNSTGTVTLSNPAPSGGVIVMLTNTNPAAVVPSSVTVPAGAKSARFTVATSVVSTTQTGKVIANYGGTSKSSTLNVRPMGVLTLTLVPNTVVGGDNTIGVITLECRAAPGDITVMLSSNSSVASPSVSNVTILAGARRASFNITTSMVTSNQSVTITATANGITKSCKLTVTP